MSRKVIEMAEGEQIEIRFPGRADYVLVERGGVDDDYEVNVFAYDGDDMPLPKLVHIAAPGWREE